MQTDIKKILISHPTGNEFFRHASSGLVKEDMLQGFYTAVAVFEGNLWHKVSEIPSFSDFKRRSYDRLLEPISHTKPFRELGRLAAQKLKLTRLTTHESGFFSVDHVYQDMDHFVSRRLKRAVQEGLSGIYAYEDGAYSQFQKAKKYNIPCIYDLPIGYWRAMRSMLAADIDANPAWASTHINFLDTDLKLNRKDEELKLADHIIVASSFTANTLSYFPGKLAPIHVIPYGFPPAVDVRDYPSTARRKLKVLFVGHLSQRKGIGHLFESVEGLSAHVDLTVVGLKAVENCQALNQALSKHKWIPSLPHRQILDLMREHDVLVFPSLFEGFGMVITEAMSQGTPVITTERTAGPDIIQDGENGWLIPAGSTEALKTVLDEILSKPTLLADVGAKALETARLRTWSSYSSEVVSTVHKIIN